MRIVTSIYDLGRLAAKLTEAGNHDALSTAIRQALTAASAATDLMKAEQHLVMIERLQAQGGMPNDFSTEEGGTLIGGLFLAAVVIYARATVTTPIDRWRWWGPEKLSAELRTTHNLCIHLRDKEFAHFGRGMPIDGEPLHMEVLYLRWGASSPINYRGNSWATRPPFVFEMLRLVRQVHADAKARMKITFRAVAVAIRDGCAADPSLGRLINSFPILDPRLTTSGAGDELVEGSQVTKKWTTAVSRVVNRNPRDG